MVKLEGGASVCPQIEAIVKASIPVCAHLGLTPQSINMFGGFKVQGKTEEAAKKIIDDARKIEAAGASMVVLEGIPTKLAQIITKELTIPTIGIGAGQQSRIHCTRLAGQKADNWWLRQSPQVLGLQFVDGIRRADRDNTIDLYIGEDYMDVLAEGEWQKFFKVKPDVFTAEEKRAWLDKNTDVALGSDAFFPFGDNIERAHKSGVKYVAQPGGSVRDDHVIDTCNKYGMVMSFTGIRLFHH